MPISPNTAFHRVYFDLPTPLAIRIEEAVNSGLIPNRSKKEFYTRAVELHLNNLTGDHAQQAKKKPSKRAKKGE